MLNFIRLIKELIKRYVPYLNTNHRNYLATVVAVDRPLVAAATAAVQQLYQCHQIARQ